MSWKEPRYDTLTWIDSRRHSMVWGDGWKGKTQPKNLSTEARCRQGIFRDAKMFAPASNAFPRCYQRWGWAVGTGTESGPIPTPSSRRLVPSPPDQHRNVKPFLSASWGSLQKGGFRDLLLPLFTKPVLQDREERWVWVCVCVWKTYIQHIS